MKRLALALAVVAMSVAAPTADEGMWNFDSLPKDEVAKKYGVEVSDEMDRPDVFACQVIVLARRLDDRLSDQYSEAPIIDRSSIATS
jgi:hypothetical protein